MRRSGWGHYLIGLLLVCGATLGAPAEPVSPVAPPAAQVTSPSYGGVLDVLASGDVDYLDPNISYYPLAYGVLHTFARQLYAFPASAGRTTRPVPDLATGAPRRTGHGRVYRVTLRSGVRWDTASPREVTAADVVRGVKVTCNPYQPFGGVFELLPLIRGMGSFCHGFARAGPDTRSMRRYMRTHEIRGVRAVSRRTVAFRLRHRDGDFADMLALPAFSPRPKEALVYAPGSAVGAQHTISDGPYEVRRYVPGKELVLTRNPVWRSDTDPLRPAYADRVVISMTSDAAAAVRKMRRGDADADVFLGAITADVAQRRLAAGDPRLVVAPSVVDNPYLLFNTASPTGGGALGKRRVRRALSYALGRHALIEHIGGRRLNPPLTHVLPRQILGSRPFDLYPHDPRRARQLLRDAGATDLSLTFLYRPSSPTQTALMRAVRRQLGRVGVTVEATAVPDADFYTKYLQNPSSAQSGRWDMAAAGWAPDWLGNAARSFFGPLFDGRTMPPVSDDFGLYDNARVDREIDAASRAHGRHAARLWHRVDRSVIADAPVFPISSPRTPTYHAAQVHGYVFEPFFGAGDLTAMWLDPADDG